MKNKHGGTRKGSGAPKLPEDEHKKQVWIYLPENQIIEWGGLKKLQADIKKWFYSALKSR